MGLLPWMNEFESKRIKFNLTSKILLSNNYCTQKLYQIINIQKLYDTWFIMCYH